MTRSYFKITHEQSPKRIMYTVNPTVCLKARAENAIVSVSM